MAEILEDPEDDLLVEILFDGFGKEQGLPYEAAIIFYLKSYPGNNLLNKNSKILNRNLTERDLFLLGKDSIDL